MFDTHTYIDNTYVEHRFCVFDLKTISVGPLGVCMYIYVYIYIYIYTHTYTSLSLYIYIYIHIYTHTHI